MGEETGKMHYRANRYDLELLWKDCEDIGGQTGELGGNDKWARTVLMVLLDVKMRLKLLPSYSF